MFLTIIDHFLRHSGHAKIKSEFVTATAAAESFEDHRIIDLSPLA